MMLLLSSGWFDVIGWNFRQVGLLWAAWAGGASTVHAAYADGESKLLMRGTIEDAPKPAPQPELKRRHLQIVD